MRDPEYPASLNKEVAAERLVQDARYQGARMLRDDQVLTPILKDQVRAKLKEYIDRHGVTLERIALRLDCEPSVISSVLSGTYKADDAKWIRALDRWMGEHAIKNEAERPRKFVKTGTARLIYGAAKWAQKYNSIALAYGPAGVGKTMTMKALASEIDASIYISCRTGCESPLAVLSMIGRAARITCRRESIAAWTQRLEETLAGSDRLILIDEVHKLINVGVNDRALHVLRDLHDATECPMLWLGTSEILTHIQEGVSRGRERLDQLSSRIGPWVDLAEGTKLRDGTRDLITTDDLRLLFQQDGMRISPDAYEYLRKHANIKGAGAYRAAVKLVQIAALDAKGGAITAELLDKALPLRSGTAVAKLRRTQMKAQDQRSQLMVAAG